MESKFYILAQNVIAIPFDFKFSRVHILMTGIFYGHHGMDIAPDPLLAL